MLCMTQNAFNKTAIEEHWRRTYPLNSISYFLFISKLPHENI